MRMFSNGWPDVSGQGTDPDFLKSINDLIRSDIIWQMDAYIHHSDVTCLEHCLAVSFFSYRLCSKLGLDRHSAARGGLVHDLYLYDWHVAGSHKGLHGFNHPLTAYRNATRLFALTELEKDIVLKHMWPLTIAWPRYRESWVVTMVDKYCTLAELAGLHRHSQLLRFKQQLLAS